VFEAGENFGFDLHFFDTRPGSATLINDLRIALGKVASEGIGPLRGIAEVTGVVRETKPIDLAPLDRAPSRIAVEFRTPTELKSGGEIMDRPEFGVLFGRVRDRVSTLRALYGVGPVPVDFQAIGERANAIQLESCSIHQVRSARRSSRTGQSHSIGGFVGEAQYCGPFEEFLPWLRAAEWTGVGRHTVWGNGEIRLRVLE
jgi:CRISPR/Cas system endoribonuclease Cas6 (RAMP superfamily)